MIADTIHGIAVVRNEVSLSPLSNESCGGFSLYKIAAARDKIIR